AGMHSSFRVRCHCAPQSRNREWRHSTPRLFSTTVIVVPANLSPEYKAAEAAFRKSRDPRERLECLREMLRTIPKHKGTERLQADIKARIKDLSEDLEGGRRGGGGHSGGPEIGRASCRERVWISVGA